MKCIKPDGAESLLVSLGPVLSKGLFLGGFLLVSSALGGFGTLKMVGTASCISRLLVDSFRPGVLNWLGSK